jgi:hypothetical protein
MAPDRYEGGDFKRHIWIVGLAIVGALMQMEVILSKERVTPGEEQALAYASVAFCAGGVDYFLVLSAERLLLPPWAHTVLGLVALACVTHGLNLMVQAVSPSAGLVFDIMVYIVACVLVIIVVPLLGERRRRTQCMTK